ncbi:39S ribosomal protein L52, mitochondrial-like isoform X2 [Ostrea edulis]|uniref:39S ribosomal protein L52, mitochondrial-like isoform X2 n=1 Tax=Ostrea edulis TaxID=37623 RepID=UPI002095B1D0|nr:39S ribosomal protein L52, mitochondrial-like isoform X2 [Ostrea edulis]
MISTMSCGRCTATKMLREICSVRSFSTSAWRLHRFKSQKINLAKGFGSKWRLANGKALDGKKYGPLTDLPDYTFLDGRPTPLTRKQQQRLAEKKQVAARVDELLGELNFAKERYREQMKNKQTEKPFPLKPKS